MDPLDPELHRVATPLYQHALTERDALNEKLLQRGKDLDRAGFDAQVKVTSRSTLLFYLGEGVRQVITASNGKFQAGDKSWPRDELIHLTHAEPGKFSPNALFRRCAGLSFADRGVCGRAGGDFVFCAIGGDLPASSRRMPVMLPRAGFTLVDAKATKLLRRYGLTVEDVWAGPQSLLHKMEGASVPKGLSKTSSSAIRSRFKGFSRSSGKRSRNSTRR